MKNYIKLDVVVDVDSKLIVTIIPLIRRWWNIKSPKRKKIKEEFDIFKNS